MLTLLYIFQFIISFLLIFFIFLQKREETTSLLSSNSYNSMFKSLGVPSNPLVKITLIIGVLFFLNTILISAILLKQAKTPSDLIQKVEEYNNKKPNITNLPPADVGNKNNNIKNQKNNKPINNKETNNLPAVPLGNIK